MESFGSNLDGYYDVENQLPRHLRDRAADHFDRTDARKEAIRTVSDHERRATRLRKAFIDELGGLPETDAPLNAQTTGEITREDYAVERVVFESLPDFHVTGNVYRPDDERVGEGGFPAVLFLCGHATVGKAAGLYQQACIELVSNGVLAFAIDPIGQGERIQSYDPETGEYARANTVEHTYLGQQCLVAGSNLARYFVHDMVRAVDYLTSREDVDAGRLGATGNSGGGMQTGFLALVDDRIDAAAPCCFVTQREAYMETGQAQDGEQIVYRAIDHGLDYDDFVAAFAPKPMLIGSAQSDFLCIDGSRTALERARDVYELYDRADHVQLAVTDDTHGLSAPLREAVVNWFRQHLRGVDPDHEAGDPETLPPEDLQCTTEGQVVGEYADERRIVDLNREFIHREYGDAGSAPGPDEVSDPTTYASDLGETVRGTLGLGRATHPLFPRRIEEEVDEDAGVRWEKCFFFAEANVVVAGIVAVALDEPETTRPTVVLTEHGTEEFDDYADRVAELARERGLAMVFDPRGVGAVRARDVNTPLANGGEYFEYHGTEYKLGSDAVMLGDSLFGMRVGDVLRAREYLARRADEVGMAPEGFGVEGVGVGSLHALYAAAADPDFRSVRLRDLPYSFYELATREEYEIDFRLRVHGVVGVCDVPQMLPALADRDVEWVGVDPDRFR